MLIPELESQVQTLEKERDALAGKKNKNKRVILNAVISDLKSLADQHAGPALTRMNSIQRLDATLDQLKAEREGTTNKKRRKLSAQIKEIQNVRDRIMPEEIVEIGSPPRGTLEPVTGEIQDYAQVGWRGTLGPVTEEIQDNAQVDPEEEFPADIDLQTEIPELDLTVESVKTESFAKEIKEVSAVEPEMENQPKEFDTAPLLENNEPTFDVSRIPVETVDTQPDECDTSPLLETDEPAFDVSQIQVETAPVQVEAAAEQPITSGGYQLVDVEVVQPEQEVGEMDENNQFWCMCCFY